MATIEQIPYLSDVYMTEGRSEMDGSIFMPTFGGIKWLFSAE